MSWPYGAAMAIRNKAFDAGVVKERAVDVPVISVGNITAGGTGKTPLVEHLVEWLLQRGEKAAVVSRGYGRRTSGLVVVSDGVKQLADAESAGDEPCMLARHVPGAIVVVAGGRYDAARHAVEHLGASVVVMDDGFQHRHLHRDLDIVVVAAHANPADEPLLPAGDRREWMSSLERADLIVVTRVSESDGPVWSDRLKHWYDGPVALARYRTTVVCRLDDNTVLDQVRLKEKPVLVFSGIGDHAGFVHQVRLLGAVVCAEQRFPDHHRYTVGDMEHVARVAHESRAEMCLTTEKDAERLRFSDGFRALTDRTRFYSLRAAIEFIAGGDHLHRKIEQCLTAHRRGAL